MEKRLEHGMFEVTKNWKKGGNGFGAVGEGEVHS